MQNKQFPEGLFTPYDVLMSGNGMIKLRNECPTAYIAKFMMQYGKLPENLEGLDTTKLTAYLEVLKKGERKVVSSSARSINAKPIKIPEGFYKPFDVLMSGNGMIKLRKESPTAYAAKYYQKYGVRPQMEGDTIDDAEFNEYIKELEKDKVNKESIPEELFLSYDELNQSGKLNQLQTENYALYAIKHKEKFGEYPDDMRNKVDFYILGLYEGILKEYYKNELSKMTWEELLKAGLTNKYLEIDERGYIEKFTKYYGYRPSGL